MTKDMKMENEMIYDPGEIVYMYKHARKKEYEIKILAELNLTSTYDICEILESRGALEDCATAKRYYIFKDIYNGVPEEEIKKKHNLTSEAYKKLAKKASTERNYEESYYDEEKELKKQITSYNKKLSKKEREISILRKELSDAAEIITVLQKDIKILSLKSRRKSEMK